VTNKSTRPTLVTPRHEAEQKLIQQIDKGREILEMPINDPDELDKTGAKYKKWDMYNDTLLKHIVDTDDLYDEYQIDVRGLSYDGKLPHEEPENFRFFLDSYRFHAEVQAKLTCLEAILEKLGLIPESSTSIPAQAQFATPISNKVFVVHGHDERARKSVAGLLRKLKLIPIVLQDQVTKGKTIIESLEDHSDVAFAVVILTPDDQAASYGTIAGFYKPQARQNVIFEWGYFVAKLGRSHVCALVKGKTEIPSDLSGVLFHKLDDNGVWENSLIREMKAANVPLDLDGLLD